MSESGITNRTRRLLIGASLLMLVGCQNSRRWFADRDLPPDAVVVADLNDVRRPRRSLDREPSIAPVRATDVTGTDVRIADARANAPTPAFSEAEAWELDATAESDRGNLHAASPTRDYTTEAWHEESPREHGSHEGFPARDVEAGADRGALVTSAAEVAAGDPAARNGWSAFLDNFRRARPIPLPRTDLDRDRSEAERSPVGFDTP